MGERLAVKTGRLFLVSLKFEKINPSEEKRGSVARKNKDRWMRVTGGPGTQAPLTFPKSILSARPFG